MTVLETRDVSFSYGGRPTLFGIDLAVGSGESVGIVGESGAGKSTLLSLLLGLAAPARGDVLFEGVPLRLRDRVLMRRFRQTVQAVFQDPYSSLDPRQRIDRTIAEPLESLGIARGAATREPVRAALASVGLPEDAARRYPHEFSGGQRQRIAIARAIVVRPRVLIADEPVSALDMSTRMQVIDLLRNLRTETGLALVMVSHDLGTVAAVCDRTVVLERGRIVEAADTRTVLNAPAEEYTRRLVAAIPRLP
ncbi:ABC transporter ATP-binding protein [Microbacterium resistens]|uniref:ABC transporter ATP-binding protein n=1 Tax=Microbacterium resistens TaxID=156977 RepID=UPI001C57EA80|nr:ABC transporter ATP-binding protein [Microbacterium resistens]MBW1637804.1 ABC transporter ATP-binding protein [Microbacterium resistens]